MESQEIQCTTPKESFVAVGKWEATCLRSTGVLCNYYSGLVYFSSLVDFFCNNCA